MRANAIAILLATLVAGIPARAADRTTPDYSRQTLMRLFVEPPKEETQSRIRYHIGAIDFYALGTQWRFNYLPIAMPLSGTRFGVTSQLPDAFALTGTPLATSPRVWRERRAIEKELRRIGKTSAKVKVKTN